jgi:mercuric ion transport protein
MLAIRQQRGARSGRTTIVKTGIVGSVVAAICIATPIPVTAFGALGLSA